jgi:hypothetical protein
LAVLNEDFRGDFGLEHGFKHTVLRLAGTGLPPAYYLQRM